MTGHIATAETEIAAPATRVWKALTDPGHLVHWWGLRRHIVTIDTLNVRPGGAWRVVLREPDGTEIGFRGEYKEVVPPERLVQTFEYEPMAGHIVLETTTLEDREGKTLLTRVSAMNTPEERDGIVQSGMEAGTREIWDRLEEFLENLKKEKQTHG